MESTNNLIAKWPSTCPYPPQLLEVLKKKKKLKKRREGRKCCLWNGWEGFHLGFLFVDTVKTQIITECLTIISLRFVPSRRNITSLTDSRGRTTITDNRKPKNKKFWLYPMKYKLENYVNFSFWHTRDSNVRQI